MYDVVIIGAGIVGCAIARELSKYNIRIGLLEKASDVSSGASKSNSGIIHGGYSDKPGSLKAKFCYSGNQMYQKLNGELNFGFLQTGSLVVGFDQQDAIKLHELFEYGQKNGVPNLQIVNEDFVKNREPNLNKKINTALYCPGAGIISPYEAVIALAENAIQNKAELKLNHEVTSIQKCSDHFLVTSNNHNTLATKILINAAGLYSDEVARMVGINSFTIKPRQGQYLLFDKDQGNAVNSVIFQVPTDVSKGILVTKTYHGNLLIGPDATEAPTKEDTNTKSENINEIIRIAKKTLPDFDLRKVITMFSGNRAASSNHDFIIEESKIKGFINVAGIESPGLTSAPAIAAYVIDIVRDIGLIKMEQKTDFNPHRPSYNKITELQEEALRQLIKKDSKYGHVVCRCEVVSEGEICDALRRGIPINSLDAIKKRTRSCMGKCQGGFCTPKIMDIISRELKIPKEEITKHGGQSPLVVGKTKK